MHFHMPKPLSGWREFAGEVGIIVIGVLIALGAEQVVEALQWNGEVENFREALRGEVTNDLGTYQYRMNQNACVKHRLDELEEWLAGWRAGRPRKLVRAIAAPISLSINTSVWASRDANLVSHMPMDERMTLGALYDEFANNEVHRLDERETWLRLGEFDGAVSLDHGDMMRLRGLISRARYRDDRIGRNARGFFPAAASMGFKPYLSPTFPVQDVDLCASLFTSREMHEGR